ncbi:2-oxoglutarate (2OG) and Fe(II)-dependent oxygenase superfamily protein isoform X2 [Wolffia australiana]
MSGDGTEIGNVNGVLTTSQLVPAGVGRPSPYGDRRLRLNPNTDHKSERYDDVQGEFDSSIFSSLERHLPPSMLEVPRDAKVQFMKDILARYLSLGDRARIQRHREYRNRIMDSYQPLHQELYDSHPSAFLVPSFIKAISEKTEESLKSIISQPSPGIFVFSMLQPRFCQLLLSEVENFEKWVRETKFKIMRPNTMNRFGAVLDDFGLERMLDKLMEEFICPISGVFFPDVGGASLDSHHGFVVEYGKNRDVDLGFHVDDAEVTLNVCVGTQFTGGNMFFRGVRCDKHELVEYAHVPGQAVLHRGRHRHGALATTSGHRINLLLWCKSSVFREMKKYQKECSSWCGECQREKKERLRQSAMATKLAFIRRREESPA